MSNLIDRDLAIAAIWEALHADTDILSAVICGGIAQVLNGLPTVETMLPTGHVYRCDPEKNRDCRKTGCYINGGDCYQTQHPEYAKEERR